MEKWERVTGICGMDDMNEAEPLTCMPLTCMPLTCMLLKCIHGNVIEVKKYLD
jgi:hypothetical protein